MKRLLLIAAALTALQTSAQSSDQTPVLLAQANIGATALDWYVRGVETQPIDPNRPTFYSVRVTGRVTAQSLTLTGTAAATLNANGMTWNPTLGELALTSSLGYIYFANQGNSTGITTANISAANAGATSATSAFKFYPQQVLDATDYVLSVGPQGNGSSLFNVAYNGAVTTSGSITSGLTGFRLTDSANTNSGIFAGSAAGTTAISANVRGDVANSASNSAVNIYNVTTMTAGVDRYIAQFWNDNATTVRARVTTDGTIQSRLGTGTDFPYAPGILCVVSTAVGNVGASGPDDLQTCSIAANGLITTNRGVRVTAWGTCANNANAKTFTLNFGSQVILTHACTASVAGETWKIDSEVLRTGASAQDWHSVYIGNTGAAGVFEYDPELGTATQTETATIVVKMQSTVSTSNNDIVQEGMIVEAL